MPRLNPEFPPLMYGGGLQIQNGCLTIVPGSGGVGDVLGPSSSSDNTITIWDGTTGKTIQASTLGAGILVSSADPPVVSVDHDAATNFVSDEHVAHSGVTLTAGDGLAGGGTIAANRTFTVDISPLTAIGTIDGANDLLIIEDATDGAIRKVAINDVSLGGGGLGGSQQIPFMNVGATAFEFNSAFTLNSSTGQLGLFGGIASVGTSTNLSLAMTNTRTAASDLSLQMTTSETANDADFVKMTFDGGVPHFDITCSDASGSSHPLLTYTYVSDSVAWNSNAFTGVGTIGCGAITGTSTLAISGAASGITDLTMSGTLDIGTIDMSAASGVLTIVGEGGSNNESVTLDLETTANMASWGTGTGVVTMNLNYATIGISHLAPDAGYLHMLTTGDSAFQGFKLEHSGTGASRIQWETDRFTAKYAWGNADTTDTRFVLFAGTGTNPTTEVMQIYSTQIGLNVATVLMNDSLKHNGDTDTLMKFETDKITLSAGGADFIIMTETTTNTMQLGLSGMEIAVYGATPTARATGYSTGGIADRSLPGTPTTAQLETFVTALMDDLISFGIISS